VRQGDHAVAAGSAPLAADTPAVLLTAGRRSAVRLAAGSAGATVGVVERSARGRVVAEDELALRPDGSLELVPGARTASVIVTPRDGQLYAAAVHSGAGMAVQPAPPVPWTVVRPAVRQPTS
jgi:hypothetical protein